MQVIFTDPKTNTKYSWPINPGYDGVPTPVGKQRQIERTSNTGNVGATKQQGDDGPYIIHWEPSIFHSAHREQLWHWFALCAKQTIYLTDWLGEQAEGQIVTLQEHFIGALAGPGDTNANLGYWKMVFDFEVYRWLSGALLTAGVTP